MQNALIFFRPEREKIKTFHGLRKLFSDKRSRSAEQSTPIPFTAQHEDIGGDGTKNGVFYVRRLGLRTSVQTRPVTHKQIAKAVSHFGFSLSIFNVGHEGSPSNWGMPAQDIYCLLAGLNIEIDCCNVPAAVQLELRLTGLPLQPATKRSPIPCYQQFCELVCIAMRAMKHSKQAQPQ
jgi:hypothetical protein